MRVVLHDEVHDSSLAVFSYPQWYPLFFVHWLAEAWSPLR